ncbi:MAG: sigma-70 family RNA polymerase sigma factor [Thermoanaerobaculia bacterium]
MESVTYLLERWSAGDRTAAEQVMPLVYDHLRRIAARHLGRGRGDQTLQATAIVHEAYLRLQGQGSLPWASREHFFAFAARLIRQILVDHARHRHRLKRGGRSARVTLSEAVAWEEARSPDVLALDQALERLEGLDRRKATIVELRFFAGMTIEETAGQLGISVETVGREWRRARAWLSDQLESGG